VGANLAGLLDDFTPWEVWREKAARKTELYLLGLPDSAYDEAILALADELGLGVPPDELTGAQRAAQARAIEKWRGRPCAK
jgi:hypothetical protein